MENRFEYGKPHFTLTYNIIHVFVCIRVFVKTAFTGFEKSAGPARGGKH
jgi:hypothetical protein